MNIDHALKIKGWMSEAELMWLAEQADKSTVIVETGSYLGRSTRALADNTNGVVLAFDPYIGEYKYDNGKVMRCFRDNEYQAFLKNLRDHLDSRRVIQYRMPLEKSRIPLKPDLIFLDGDHRYGALKQEILLALELSPRILAGHDYTHPDWPGVKKAVDEILGPVQLHESIWIKKY